MPRVAVVIILSATICMLSGCERNNSCYFQTDVNIEDNRSFRGLGMLPESLCGKNRTNIPIYFKSVEVIPESIFSHTRRFGLGQNAYLDLDDFEYLYRVDGEVVSFERNPTIEIQKEYLDTVTVELFIYRNDLFDYSWKRYRDDELIEQGE